jgi:hypothetical protein
MGNISVSGSGAIQQPKPINAELIRRALERIEGMSFRPGANYSIDIFNDYPRYYEFRNALVDLVKFIEMKDKTLASKLTAGTKDLFGTKKGSAQDSKNMERILENIDLVLGTNTGLIKRNMDGNIILGREQIQVLTGFLAAQSLR